MSIESENRRERRAEENLEEKAEARELREEYNERSLEGRNREKELREEHFDHVRTARRRGWYGRRHVRHVNIWLAIGVTVLIVLLLLWLTFADLTGNTDVSAAPPL